MSAFVHRTLHKYTIRKKSEDNINTLDLLAVYTGEWLSTSPFAFDCTNKLYHNILDE